MSSRTSVVVGEIAEYIRGISFKPDDVVALGAPGSVACMRTKNVQRELDLEDIWAIPESFVRRREQFLQAGDILISSANSWNLVGKCCWIPELPWRGSFGGFVSVLRANPQRVEPRYLYRWFSWERTQATLRSFGRQTTNISNLDVERCLAMHVPLPSPCEQRRIADVLDRAEALQAKRTAAAEKLEVLKETVFVEMFGDVPGNPMEWPEVTLGDLVSGIRNGFNADQRTEGGGWPITRIETISKELIDLSRVRWIDPNDSILEDFQLHPGDILFSHINSVEHIGKTAIYVGVPERLIHGINLLRLRPDTRVVEPRWLLHLLRRPEVRAQFQVRCKRAVNQASLNQGDITRLPVFLPPLRLQQDFVRRIASVEEVRKAHSFSAALMGELFVSLQQRAFSDGM